MDDGAVARDQGLQMGIGVQLGDGLFPSLARPLRHFLELFAFGHEPTRLLAE